VRDLHELDHWRITDAKALTHVDGWPGDETCGSFVIQSRVDGADMVVVASNGSGWDHVSVSRKNRVPNWAEMSQIHRQFFKDNEVAMQLHLPVDLHIDIHKFVLHLWRSHTQVIELPPRIFV
jgi:hypothetical protein